MFSLALEIYGGGQSNNNDTPTQTKTNPNLYIVAKLLLSFSSFALNALNCPNERNIGIKMAHGQQKIIINCVCSRA